MRSSRVPKFGLLQWAIILALLAVGIKYIANNKDQLSFLSSDSEPISLKGQAANATQFVSNTASDLPAGLSDIAQSTQNNFTDSPTSTPVGDPANDVNELPEGMQEITGESYSDKPSEPVRVQPMTKPDTVSKPTPVAATRNTITINTPTGNYGSVLRERPNGTAFSPVPGKTAGIDYSGVRTHLVPDGAVVPVYSWSGPWANVQHEGVNGWVFVPQY